MSDPVVEGIYVDFADLAERHTALLERVTVLEKAIEDALRDIAVERLGVAQKTLEDALDA